MLSFAPSAAAVGHCDLVRITWESNSVRHSVFIKRWALQPKPPQTQPDDGLHEVEFKADGIALVALRCVALHCFFLVLCLRCSYQKCFKNRVECFHFCILLANASPFLGTLPPIFSQNMFEKQDGMPAFLYTFSLPFWSLGYPFWSLMRSFSPFAGIRGTMAEQGAEKVTLLTTLGGLWCPFGAHRGPNAAPTGYPNCPKSLKSGLGKPLGTRIGKCIEFYRFQDAPKPSKTLKYLSRT